MSNVKCTAFTQCTEHHGKHSTNRNSAHRKSSTVHFNRSRDITIAKAVNVQHINIFGICEDVRSFSQHSYNVIINHHNGQLTLHTDSRGADSGAQYSVREGKHWAPNPNYSISETVPNRTHVHLYTLLLRTTFQNIDVSSWDVLYCAASNCRMTECSIQSI
jgi:hypothetical protein